MSERRKRQRNEKGCKSNVDKDSASQEVDESSVVIKMFRAFQQELDSRNDKYERIVKLSRDITIESKRAIFLLHRVTNATESADILQQTEEKLAALENTKFKEIAQELEGTDPFQFLRAYSPGLQEYIEAVTFMFYLKTKSLIPLPDVQARLTFQHLAEISGNSVSHTQDSDQITGEKSEETIGGNIEANDKNVTDDEKLKGERVEGCSKTLKVLVPASEYILGVADLTGEMMRKAINAVGSGDLDRPFEVCGFLQEVESAYSALGNANREVHRKLHTLRQSLRKVESACYTLKVRGSEIPKHMLVDVISKPSMSEFRVDDMELVEDD